MKSIKEYPAEVYLNGSWMRPQQAMIPVFDRGFMFGDGIYEVTPYYSGKAFRLKEHLERLQYCLNEVQIIFDASSLEEKMAEAVERAGLTESDAAVYVQITRGVAPRTHYYAEKVSPTVLLYAYPVKLEGFETKEWKVLSSKDKRWHRCDIKSTALLANVMANEEAISRDFDENILVRKGYFTEGSHSTIFFVKHGAVYTHPEGPHILSGITRKVILDLCKCLKIKIKVEKVHLDELVEVDEIFVTGTTTQIMRVASVHSLEKEIFRSRKNDVTSLLQKEFLKLTRG